MFRLGLFFFPKSSLIYKVVLLYNDTARQEREIRYISGNTPSYLFKYIYSRNCINTTTLVKKINHTSDRQVKIVHNCLDQTLVSDVRL